MTGSKDDREVAPAAGAANGNASPPGATGRPLPPLRPAPPPSSRGGRAAPAARDGAVVYSHVGRRSSPGFPAQAVAVENLRVASDSGSHAAAPPVEEPIARAAPPPSVDAPVAPAGSDRAPGVHHSRPPAPDAFRAELVVDSDSIAQTLDRLVAGEGGADRAPSFPREELTAPRELFGTLAAAHVRPVRDLLIELRWGEASRDGFAVAAGAVTSLRSAAEKLSLNELVVALGTFADALASADVDHPGPAMRAGVMSAYDELVRLLPAAFAIESERVQRETHIVQSLVLKAQGANRTTIERIVAAGLGTITALADARPSEVAEVTGIPLAVATRVVEAVQAYREQRRAPADAAGGGERARLRALCVELASQQVAFERASDGWSLDATAEKRRLRAARERTLLEITAVLARLGEIPLLEQIEKVPFQQKVERLRSYLGTASAPH